MVPQYQRNLVRTHGCRVALALLAGALLSVLSMNTTYAQSDPIPPEIKNLRMGSSTAAVTDIIKSMGTFSAEPIANENRTMLVWARQDLPYYKNIAFQFTEKDRLYLIRFTLNDSAKADYHSLKRSVFKDYDFSWERPQKLRLPTREMLLYGPEKGMELYFIEFTDKKSHEKSFELFNRSISSEDRPEPRPIAKQEGQEQKPATGLTPEEAGKSPAEDGNKPPTETKSEPEKTTDSNQPVVPTTETPKPSTAEKAAAPQEKLPDKKPDAK
jgi:hypothetical protein